MDSINYKGYTINISPCSDSDSPSDWDNVGEIHVMSNRYFGGDFNHSKSHMDEVCAEAKRNNDIIYPLFAYVHSGVTLKISEDGNNPFYGNTPAYHAHFDSGQTGFVIVRRKKAIEEFGNKILTKKVKEKVLSCVKSEIKTYNQYLNGEVYSYSIKDADGEEIDSCCGFFGSDSVEEAAKEAIDAEISREEELAKAE